MYFHHLPSDEAVKALSSDASRGLTERQIAELREKHGGIPHGGFVLRSGKTGYSLEHNQLIEYSLKLDSNPEFTASVIIAYARAAYRLAETGESGCKTVFDIPPALLINKTPEELRATLL